jgi:uncharacterized protein YggT (Ycf19 family)
VSAAWHASCDAVSMRTYAMEEGPPTRRRAVAVVARVLDYCFGLLYLLLGIRLVLELIGARTSAGFYQFIARTGEPFYRPFRAIVPTDTAMGVHVVWALVVAIVAYMILHAVLRALLHLLTRA